MGRRPSGTGLDQPVRHCPPTALCGGLSTVQTGRFTPATHLPIVSPEELEKGEVEAVIVLAASYSDEVVRTLLTRHGQRFSIAVLRGQHLERVGQRPSEGTDE